MGWVKQQYLGWLEFQRRNEDASYEEAQSRLRMSTLCKDCVRELEYPLFARIVEPAISAQAGGIAALRTTSLAAGVPAMAAIRLASDVTEAEARAHEEAWKNKPFWVLNDAAYNRIMDEYG